MYIRWLITIFFRCFQVIIVEEIVPRNDYYMPNSQYDDANVILQMMNKTPVAVS